MLAGLKVTVSGLDQVVERLDRMRNLARLRPVAKHFAGVFERIYKKHTPVSKYPNQPSPGKMRAGWKGSDQVDEPKGKVLILIRNVDPRAKRVWPLLLKGTRRHVIQAVRTRMLAFRFRDGEQFFGPRVKHPGARRAVDTGTLNREVQAELIRLKKRIAEVMVQDKPAVGPT